MMKTVSYQLLLGVALVVGVAIGYFAAPSETSAPAGDRLPPRERALIEDKGESASVAALRTRIAELEALLAAGRVKQKEAVSNAVAEVRAAAPARPPNPREWMENLKKNDPARYTQMTNRFAQFRRNRAARAQARAEFLASINTSGWSSSAQKTHDEVQELLARREELEEALHREGTTDDQRRKIFEEMRETDHELREANKTERANLMTEVAKAIGLEGEAATDLTETIKEVYEATESGRHGPPGPPPGGGNAGGGAPGAGGPPPM